MERALNRVAIPNNEYYEYYGPDYELDVRPSNMTDHNTPEYLDKLREAVFEVLRDKNAAPSVQMQGACTGALMRDELKCPSEVPKLSHDDAGENDMEDGEDRDTRRTRKSEAIVNLSDVLTSE